MTEGNTRRWCQFVRSSTIWFESSFFTGACKPPAHPKVRMWNRCVAAHQYSAPARSPRDPSKRRLSTSQRKAQTIERGAWVQAIRRRVFNGSISRPASLRQPDGNVEDVIPLDTTHVVYAIVPMAKMGKIYVGATSLSAWTRHGKRLNKVAPPPSSPCSPDDELSPFELHLRQAGLASALHDYYIMVLEVVAPSAPADGATEGEDLNYMNEVRPYERFWITTLHSAFGDRGWNIEHAPDTLRFDARGRPTRERSANPPANGPCRRTHNAATARAPVAAESQLQST
eukprot:5744797-Prymnesium_polylepis.1